MTKQELRELANVAIAHASITKVAKGRRTTTESEMTLRTMGVDILPADSLVPRLIAVDYRNRGWYTNQQGKVIGHD